MSYKQTIKELRNDLAGLHNLYGKALTELVNKTKHIMKLEARIEELENQDKPYEI